MVKRMRPLHTPFRRRTSAVALVGGESSRSETIYLTAVVGDRFARHEADHLGVSGNY